ncbi:hypothetical protein N0O92_02985 [Alkalihalobacillus sp. MEB130]|uniref:hypothetical protein n=1 Tax=Alkalihalobacillus sp. MEB130 TaxID=2976704 RepID=UPI0028DECAED|nr:hypothetical protein [Alkalihalobacillus sp. MEB130]MDT8859183.1 hypothetical protein [Alkalihalobacillus sp. MEB130]
MDKSLFLDELRLEIGLVRDEARTLSSFYVGIIRKIAKIIRDGAAISIYEATNHQFIMKVCAGPCYLKRHMAFGEGILSDVAINGDLLFKVEEDMQKLFMPFYKQHHLLGILVVHLPLDSYQVSEDDFIFLREVGRFIEVQHETYPHTS